FAERWRLARALVVLGAVAVAITLIGDRPAGLDEGALAIEFEGVHATLLGGFWAELSAAAVIALAGPLLAAYLRLGQVTARRPRRRARGRRATGEVRPGGPSACCRSRAWQRPEACSPPSR